MSKTLVRTLIPIVLVVLGVAALFFALRPEERPAADAEPRERAIDVEIQGDAMNPATISLAEGDRATLRISADRPAEFHVHGYDLEQEVAPDEPAELSFEADITGRFAIEDHETDAEMGALIVEPR